MTDIEWSPEVEWKKSAFFAEAAEALGIKTVQAMALYASGGRIYVVHTRPDEHSREVYMGVLARGEDGVLVQQGLDLLPGFFEGLQEYLRERLGEPEQ